MKRLLVFLTVTIFILTAIMVLSPSALMAVWSVGGNPVSVAPYNQTNYRSVNDGFGNTLVVWVDTRYADYDIYAQKIDPNGNMLWANDGLPVCVAAGSQFVPDIAPDGSGGAIITWDDYRSYADYDIYAQRIRSEGVADWTANGVIICSKERNQRMPRIVSDGAGGAIIAWEDNRNWNDDIYAQRINGNGAVQWATDGEGICLDVYDQENIDICADLEGGALIVWEDSRASNSDIYGQKINSGGMIRWGSNGRAVCIDINEQYAPKVAPDGLGGAMITWSDLRAGNYDIYAQRMYGSGNPAWTTDGIGVCTNVNMQVDPKIVPDGDGGAVMVWEDKRYSGIYDLFAQRVDRYGVDHWTSDGVAVCTDPFQQSKPRIVGTEDGRYIVAWTDTRRGQNDIWAQLLDGDGTKQWDSDVLASDTPGTWSYAEATSDGIGGVILVYSSNVGGYYDIQAQRIERNGYWGYPAPAIHDIRDVPGDEGGVVDLAWYASRFDPWPEAMITNYTLWRAIDHQAAQAILKAGDGARMISSASELPETPGVDVIRRETVGASEYFWKLITTVEAYYLSDYSEPMPTLFDSTAVSTEYQYFQVIAHTEDPLKFWTSEPDSGYSVDNLPPAVPLGLAGEQSYSPEGLNLSWIPNTESDLGGYAIYRGVSADFIPGPGSLVASTPDTLYLDAEWHWEPGYYYKVSALDIHGNESSYALFRPDDTTGADTPETPEASYLAQNYPNPFNPLTRIAFGLAEPAHVSLRIYNAAGQLVRVLVDEELSAAWYEKTWDGSDDAGMQVSSGIYFYRLVAGDFVQTKKMVLLR